MSAFRLIAAEKANHPVSLMCELLQVSRSGFYAWMRRPPSDRDLADAWLVEQIREIHGENRGVYGSPRIHAELRLARACAWAASAWSASWRPPGSRGS